MINNMTPTIKYHPDQLKANKVDTGFKIYENNQEITYQHIWIEKHRRVVIINGIIIQQMDVIKYVKYVILNIIMIQIILMDVIKKKKLFNI